MSYQFYNPAPVLMGLLGLEPAAGGTLTFYEKGTTTLKTTYSDEDLSIPNANPVQLDSAGRSNTQIWLDGDYSVLLKDSGGASIWTRDATSGQGASATIPSLVNGQFLTNNGTDLLWAAIRQVPDPTGSANRILSTDGANLIWIEKQTIPDPPDPDIEVTATKFTAGITSETSKYRTLTGSGSAPASGLNTTSVAVVFEEAFTTAPGFIGITPTVAQAGAGGFLPVPSVQSKSPTGFTVKFDTNGEGSSNSNITNAITFDFLAVGRITI